VVVTISFWTFQCEICSELNSVHCFRDHSTVYACMMQAKVSLFPPQLAYEFLQCSDEVVYAQRHHHHWSSVIHSSRLLTTELSRSLLFMSGTNYHTASQLRVSVIVWRLIFQPFIFWLYVVVPVKWLASLSDAEITFVTHLLTCIKWLKYLGKSFVVQMTGALAETEVDAYVNIPP